MYMFLFIFSAIFSHSLFENDGSFGLNLAVMLAVWAAFYLLCMPLYKARPELVSMIYLPATLVTINCSYNLLDLLNGDPPLLAKDDWSAVVLIPVTFIIAVIWGLLFDWKKNKIIKTYPDDE